MKKLFAMMGVAALVLAVPAVSTAQSHHGGGGSGSRESGSYSGGGGYHDQGSARSSGGGYRSGYGGGYGGYRGGYGRGYGRGYGAYYGYGFYPYFGFGFESAFFDPWYGGYPFYYGAPWYYDYGGPAYPPQGGYGDYGDEGDDYPPPPRSAARGGAWDRDYGAYDQAQPAAGASGAACGQWVWNAGAKKYDWQAGACAPAAPPAPRAGVDAPPLRVPPSGERG